MPMKCFVSQLSFVNNLVSGLFPFSKINAVVRDFRMPPNLADLDIYRRLLVNEFSSNGEI